MTRSIVPAFEAREPATASSSTSLTARIRIAFQCDPSAMPLAPIGRPLDFRHGRRLHHQIFGGDAMKEVTSPVTHVPRLVLTEQVHARVHGTSRMGRFNAAVAVRITKIVGTMYCA